MSIEAWKEIVAVPRHTIRRMRTTIRGSPLKALAELIIESEDGYYRLEGAGLPASGLIQVGYWKRMERGHETVGAFSVRDYAEGIAFESLGEKFGKYEVDTSGNSRRGYFGQGAKDALCMMRNGLLLTVHNGHVSLCRFKTENEVPKYLISDEAGAEAAMREFNGRIRGELPLDRAQNGTFVYFEIPLGQHAPRARTVKESLESISMLRKILSDPKRRVQLVDHDTGESSELRPIALEGELLYKESLRLTFASTPCDVEVSVYKAERDLNQQPGERREGGLLVVDEHDAVLDLTLFGYEYESTAAPLFGEVRLEGFKPLFRMDGTLITESREGLDYNHPFNRLLRQRVRESLAKVLERLEREAPLQKPVDVLEDADLMILRALLRKSKPVRAEELAKELGMSNYRFHRIMNERLTPRYTIRIGKRRSLVGLTAEGVKAGRHERAADYLSERIVEESSSRLSESMRLDQEILMKAFRLIVAQSVETIRTTTPRHV